MRGASTSLTIAIKHILDQWPPSQILPEFRPAMENYLNEVTLLSCRSLHLVAEDSRNFKLDCLDIPDIG